ncbi:MAG: endonuclease III [Syntrophobacteraceae bacterium]|nr:endonuclease III [Syntrophobacteraceae bacterium]
MDADDRIPRPYAEPPLEEKAASVLQLLDRMYPEARCSLHFHNPLELLVATILSAQCTDERVNRVTPALFEKYPTARDYADAPIEELEAHIKSTGFYRNKARNIRECCKIIAERFGGEVPQDLDLLVQLPGIGRKTANVVLGNSFGIPAIVVDTHVSRVARRLGLTRHKDADKIERDLMALVPGDRWTLFSHQMIQHGRTLCQARKPRCEICPLRPYCDYGSEPSL